MSHIDPQDLVIDFDKRLVTLKDKEVHLTQIEYKLVSLLAEQSGKVLTYDSVSYTHLDVYKRQVLISEPSFYVIFFI